MVWFFGKKDKTKSLDNDNNNTILTSQYSQSTSTQINNQNKLTQNQSQIFRMPDKLSKQYVQANVFKVCTAKCLKQNNSNLHKTDGMHAALFHCMQHCGQKWQNSIQIGKSMA